MKLSKTQTHAGVHRTPSIRFSAIGTLTSFAGLVVFQRLLSVLALRSRLRRCFSHLPPRVYGHCSVFLLLVVHLLMGFRRLRELEYYRGDPVVERTVGLRRLPAASTLTRTLASSDVESIRNTHQLLRELVLARLQMEAFPRITLDFDGSIQMTKGHAEGTAVGFNPKRKGARTYWPLFATVAQLSQFFGMLHRPGNVSDSTGAQEFIRSMFRTLRAHCSLATLECRVDSAFFDDAIITMLSDENVEFTCSVPFSRFSELKQLVQERQRWRRASDDWSYFERRWSPKKWEKTYRFLFLRQKMKTQQKGPLQLDLFEPKDFFYQYKVVVTNKTEPAPQLIAFHNGRGNQEKIFGEGKQHAALDVIISQHKNVNELFSLAGLLAHNLARELQMRADEPKQYDTMTRSARWCFETLGTLRRRWLGKAGRLIRPEGEMVLEVGANRAIEREMWHYFSVLLN